MFLTNAKQKSIALGEIEVLRRFYGAGRNIEPNTKI